MSTPRPDGEPDPTTPDDVPPGAVLRPVRVRRAPRYGVFVAAGAGLGLVVALVSTVSGPVDPAMGRGPLVGYLGLALALLGGLAGGVVAVVLDRVVNGKG